MAAVPPPHKYQTSKAGVAVRQLVVLLMLLLLLVVVLILWLIHCAK